MSNDSASRGAGAGGHDVPRLYYPTPYTSTIEAFDRALATVTAAIDESANSTVAIDLTLLRDTLVEMIDRVTEYERGYEPKVSLPIDPEG
jgi:hypothetical protein